MTSTMSEDARRQELALSLSEVRERIDQACRAAGREPGEVELLAVTKTFPASDAALLADLGQLRFAENREQEAREKIPEFADLRPEAEVRWHMVGQLQRNKARSVARWADVVESVDSARLVEALRRATSNALDAGERRRALEIHVQVNLDGVEGRGGCAPEDALQLCSMITRIRELRLRGVMAVAPQGNEDVAFGTLARIARDVRAETGENVDISAGMSNDLEVAVAHGSTRVRVGTALLGRRPVISD